MSSTVDRNDADNDKPITHVLFCGPQFPASHNYTREYLEKYPFIQELAATLRAIVSIKCQLDDAPSRSELIHYYSIVANNVVVAPLQIKVPVHQSTS